MNIVDSIKFRAPLQSGSYVAVIADLPKPLAIDDRGRHGVRFSLKVVEGDAKGRLAAIEFIIQGGGSASRVARDLDVLKKWCDCLSVDNAASLLELMEKLRKTAESKRIEFAVQRNEWNGGVDLYLTAVRMAPTEGGSVDG